MTDRAHLPDLPDFLRRWTTVVRRYAAAAPEERAELVALVLDRGIEALPDDPAHAEPPGDPEDPRDAERLACERDLVAASGLFDPLDYFLRNPDLAWCLQGHDEELVHFVRTGWRQLRPPYAGFDLWWYWCTYLDPTHEDVNPLVHWLAMGRHLGLPPLPDVRPLRALQHPPTPLRRVCLFAGYDADGVVDDAVVAYVRELSRFADVFYLADCHLEDGELDKLTPYTKGRWAIRHGEYDFGSYSMLARDLVGWRALDAYDELILANDSCYLVQPFDEVFAAMDRTPGDWWGLQATYDAFDHHDQERLGRPLTVDEVTDGIRALGGRSHSRERTGPAGTNVSDSRFHVGSYFVAFRSAVIGDAEFRRRLDEVTAQPDKTLVIRKYEIGLSRYLLLAGYRLATFVDGVLPFHPAYRSSAFELLRTGFPLLKRQLLAENPYDAPGLGQWRHLVREACPEADIDVIARNLLRVSTPWGLYRSLRVRERSDGTPVPPTAVGPEEFDDEDHWSPKHPHWWVFPVDPVTGRIEGNTRAVFEVIRDDPTILKIVLTAGGPFGLDGANVTVHEAESAAAQFYLLRAGQVLLSRGARRDVNHPLSGDLHQFVLLGRGSPVLAFGAAVPVSDDLQDHLDHNARVHDLDLARATVTGSVAQTEALRASLASPSGGPARWVTGSPRTDLLLADTAWLPEDLQVQEAALRDLVGDRRLVVWVPAEREAGDPATLSPEVQSAVADLADRHSSVLGVRPVDGLDLHDERVLDLSAARFPDVEMVLRVAAVVVSDYAPELIDFLVTDRPVVSFAPDLDEVRRDPGLVHDLDRLLPDGVQRDPDSLLAALDAALGEATPFQSSALADVRDLLHAFRDGRCAHRVVRRIQATYLPIKPRLPRIDR